MSDKNDKKQRKYWNDHLMDMHLNEEGEYDYKGVHYEIQGDGKAAAIKALIMSLSIDALLITAGIIPASGAMDTWYVIMPFAITIVIAGFLTYYTIKWLYRGPKRLRGYVYNKTVVRIPGFAMAASIIAAITLIMEVFYLITHGMGEYPKGAFFLMISVLLTAVLGLVLCRSVKAQEWLKIEESNE